MNIFQNASFPLNINNHKFNKKEIEERIIQVLTTINLNKFTNHKTTKLSNNQQQHLTLTRALILKPKLLLLDEPLSNLNTKLHKRMHFELKQIQHELKLTTIYITHNQNKTLTLSHKITIINTKHIIQINSPHNIYKQPNNKFITNFIDLTNFLNTTIKTPKTNNNKYQINSTINQLNITSFNQLNKNNPILISVQPEDVELTEQHPNNINIIKKKIDFKIFLNKYINYQIKINKHQILTQIHTSIKITINSTIYLHMNPKKCITIQNNL